MSDPRDIYRHCLSDYCIHAVLSVPIDNVNVFPQLEGFFPVSTKQYPTLLDQAIRAKVITASSGIRSLISHCRSL